LQWNSKTDSQRTTYNTVSQKLMLSLCERWAKNRQEPCQHGHPSPNVFTHWKNVYVVQQNNSILRGLLVIKTDGWSDYRFETCYVNTDGWKKTKGNNWKIMQGRLPFLCAALLLYEIYPPMKFQVYISKAFIVMLWTKN
jgi:hypothetical protein